MHGLRLCQCDTLSIVAGDQISPKRSTTVTLTTTAAIGSIKRSRKIGSACSVTRSESAHQSAQAAAIRGEFLHYSAAHSSLTLSSCSRSRGLPVGHKLDIREKLGSCCCEGQSQLFLLLVYLHRCGVHQKQGDQEQMRSTQHLRGCHCSECSEAQNAKRKGSKTQHHWGPRTASNCAAVRMLTIPVRPLQHVVSPFRSHCARAPGHAPSKHIVISYRG